MQRMVKNWFMNIQEYLIERKCELIESIGDDISDMLKIRDKTEDDILRLQIDDYIKFIREYVKDVDNSIEFNRRIIDERKKRQYQKIRRSDNNFNQDERRIKEEERFENQIDEQYILFG